VSLSWTLVDGVTAEDEAYQLAVGIAIFMNEARLECP
jgi:hypothetical protein